ncbi:MAG: hypothetical protein JXR83_20455 [Deltaproteobacteria bacterium]|nr:hypothetical protein [Deltaproteobacteria bacterium]
MRASCAIGVTLLALCWARASLAQLSSSDTEPLPAPPVSLEPLPESQPALPDSLPDEPETAVEPPAEPVPTSQPVEPPAAPVQPAAPSQPARVATSPLGPIVGGCAGCALCGGLPDVVAIAATYMFVMTLQQATRENVCGGLLLIMLGTIYFGMPAIISTVIAGPVGPLGAMAGTAIGAAIAGRPFWVPLLGGLPGLLLGVAGSIGVVLAVGERPEWLPDWQIALDRTWQVPGYLALAGGAALAGGPVALVGALAADLIYGAVAAE